MACNGIQQSHRVLRFHDVMDHIADSIHALNKHSKAVVSRGCKEIVEVLGRPVENVADSF